ncbi:tRNA (adenosine(37)-N6)-threonylcarbamoyltransferase complex dimerization subunit type 1 TsaB [Luteitalea sp. TBR-22]|uniref:tRNA (adenosine(37)-N6)-threonylcarbamoyltransferase complex dimerization subunit type 1 TsaB n=1 Tax=Luteitalea sp. TBR-22 TaxID=2802971 RepID=UPI001AF39199|nr:tRNA (adenosine(37)-N6)-threonylcarbamoyltransferase complex dimerization subunit type 1 TsaB [Luteitalea sp. TBR-22]BCS33407.1 tRNA (adenosine(37)-N6)-threonylcarbamoyltransferase complex dimerization subunit type 1 TsaB [Luteitalea sp. TBR-22]
MLVLALDSSTRAGSLALARDGHLLEARAGDSAVRHAARLPGDLTDLLADHGCTLADVDLLAVVVGPGGFTGLRVGLATVQGLAVALERPVFAATSLDLLGEAGAARAGGAPWVGAWMHGMRGEVFTALYAIGDDGPRPVVEPFVGTPEEAAATWQVATDGDIVVLGDAWPAMAAPLELALGSRLRPVTAPLLAAVLAEAAMRRPGEAVGPAALRPAYVRRPDAVITRERAGLPVGGDVT